MRGDLIDHDRRFKRLLSLFFREFLELFWPQFAAEVDWSRGLEFLDKEIEGVLPKSRRRTVDLLVRAHTKRRVEPGRRERLVLRVNPMKRAHVKAEALQRVQRARLGQTRLLTLVECLETYTPLDAEQQAQFDRLLATDEYTEVQKMVRSTFHVAREEGLVQGRQEGLMEGRLEGQLELLITMLEEKFGPLPEKARQRLQRLGESQVPQLVGKVLHAKSLKELGI